MLTKPDKVISMKKLRCSMIVSAILAAVMMVAMPLSAAEKTVPNDTILSIDDSAQADTLPAVVVYAASTQANLGRQPFPAANYCLVLLSPPGKVTDNAKNCVEAGLPFEVGWDL